LKRATLVRRSRAADWARLAGTLSLPVLALAALGGRVGFVPGEAILPAVSLGFLLGVAALALGAYSLTDIWNSGADGAHSAIAGLVYASPVIVALALIATAAFVYPRLTDVTTDLADPPQFAAISGHAPRPDAFAAAAQARSYPDIAPRLYPMPVSQVYIAARQLIEDRGWTLTRESHPGSMPDPEEATAPSEEADELTRALALKSVMTQSRGELSAESQQATQTDAAAEESAPSAPPTDAASFAAVAKTPLLGFEDDVVLRIRSSPEGTIVDMRSASRIGDHDLGQNARRIRSFLSALDLALQPVPETPAVSPGVVAVDPSAPEDPSPPAE
jgi:hypothetical protein